MQGRRHPLTLMALAVLLVGALGLALVSTTGVEEREEGREPDSPSPREAGGERFEAPSLTGTGTGEDEVTPPLPEPNWRLEGTLTALDGSPLENGTAYLLPKGLRGVDRLVKLRQWAQAREGGRWVVLRRPSDTAPPSPAGCWVVGLQKGHYPVFVDGDEWDGRPIRLSVRPGRNLEIRATTEDGSTPPRAWAQVWTKAPFAGDAFVYPGPETSIRVHEHGLLSPEGSLTLAVGTNDPVRVRVRCPRHYAEPEFRDAPLDAAHLLFTLHPCCSILLTPVDDHSGDPVKPRTMRIVREGHAPLDRAPTASHSSPGSYRAGELRPGNWYLEIVHPPYHDWRSPPIRLQEPGEQQEVVAELVTNPDLGALTLLVQLPREDPSRTEHLHVALRRVEGNDGWVKHGRYIRPSEPLAMQIEHLPSGHYDAIVWVGRPRLVGAVRSTRVTAGELTEQPVHVGAGLEIESTKHPEADGVSRKIEIRSPDLGRLPFMLLLRGGTRIEVTETHRGATRFGPYPVDELILIETPEGKDPVVRTVRR